MQILIQSFINAGRTVTVTVDPSDTVLSLKNQISSLERVNTDIMQLFLGTVELNNNLTIGDYGIVAGTKLKSSNIISQLATKQQRQVAKLDLATANRISEGNPDHTYDLDQLPTKYIGNSVFDNPNPGGLVLRRPWASDILADNIETEDGFNILTEDNNMIALEA
jgi:hypothetical protein